MKKKIKEWLLRYGPAEIVGKVSAILAALLANAITGNLLISAYAGTMTETAAYYLIIIVRDTHKRVKVHRRKNTAYGFRDVYKQARDLVIEFGPGELLDTFIIRPASMSLFPLIIPIYPLAILVASITSDIIFYVPTIIIYELKKKHLKD